MTALIIARFTVQEAISRRLVLAGALISLAFVVLFALGFTFLYGLAAQNARGDPTASVTLVMAGTLLTVLGLYAVYFLSSFLALFLSVGAISGEIDAGTLHAILARPLRRAEFVLGRWLAYAGLLAVYVAVMATLLLLVARLVAGYEAPDAPRAIALMVLGSVLLLTVSLFGSTLLSTLANGVVVFSLFGLAWLAGIIEVVGSALNNAATVNLGIAISLLVPSDAVWRGASYYLQAPAFLAAIGSRVALPFAASAPPTPALVIWALAYPLVFLAAAILAFRRRDL
ncbi:MAG TPA: ABC transporter permease [Chloroflexota bacterium]|nr:ABC transporter permease [Chloroflexota bacterium]